MNKEMKSTIQVAAASAGAGLGMATYPVVAGAFVAGTAAAPLAIITGIIAAGIAGCSYAVTGGFCDVQTFITGDDYNEDMILKAIGEAAHTAPAA